ncbi:NADH-quinone oxidoreductase subunit L [Roseiconus nitratireducens]|uniref:NADH-quinone oxidoreductase subunit L n=1 Tax=Roseiconus nitratireducens TaxID=2605748 RepID=A0A5M6DBY7_9BACT|nr:NADH-quinone oxidoreductase subunit L [Roseiconus nitratireducens]
MIIPALHERQNARGGYLTSADMAAVAAEINQPLHRIQAVVSFYPHFRTEPPPKACVKICRDMACHLNGSVSMTERMKAWCQQEHGAEVEVEGVSCLGRCDRPPAATINDQLITAGDEARMKAAITSVLRDEDPQPDLDWDLAEPKVGRWEMDCYGGVGRYDAVRQFLAQGADPDVVLAALEKANLLGMGGAGGRAYKKWRDVLDATSSHGEKFIVCNADESEPGTFKDREILLAAPHLTIEGVILAGLVVGAKRGWIYVRHEYPEQIERCEKEIRRATEMGACGRNLFASGRDFHLNVFPSPGGYICGEQTALIEAMEGKRAEPRIRPPELQTNGLYQQPTLLSNVETFAWVPAILRDGGEWFAGRGLKSGPLAGTAGRLVKGKRLFSVSGDVARPGVYEVENGTTLGELIDVHCGGMKDGKQIAAVALSGPSGGLLSPRVPISQLNRRFVESALSEELSDMDVRDLPLDINLARAIGFMLGAGIVVYGTGCDVLAEAVANSRFYRNESCGKCVPCRIGSQKITEMGEALLAGRVSEEQLQSFQPTATQLGDVMTATSICGLGQVAAAPMQSILKSFPELARQACRNDSREAEQ